MRSTLSTAQVHAVPCLFLGRPKLTKHNVMPCHAGELQRDHFQPPIGCPCTPQLLCTALSADKDETIQTFVNGMCDGHTARSAFEYNNTWERVYAVHGGAGAIMSVTLLEAVTTSQIEACTIKLCDERRQTGTSHSRMTGARSLCLALRRICNWPSSAAGGDGIMATCLWEAGFAVTDPGDAICSENWAPNKLFGGGEYSSGVTTRQWLRSALNATSPCNLADNRPDECDFQVWYSLSSFFLAHTLLAALEKLVSARRPLMIVDVLTGGLLAAHGVNTSWGPHGVQQPYRPVSMHGRHRSGLHSADAEAGARC